MRHCRLLLLTAAVLVTSIGARASCVVFSTLRKNGLKYACPSGSGRPLGNEWVYGNRFTIGTETDFTLDEIELAVGMISGSSYAAEGTLDHSSAVRFRLGAFRRSPLVTAARRARGRWDQVPSR
jgi:hypothetical protein